MGLRHGKCTFSQVENKKASTENGDIEANHKTEESKVSLQMSNGVVTTTPDVPLIDEYNEKSVDLCELENKQNETTEQAAANGDVPKKDQTSGVRRSSTKVVLKEWLKQRLPKKSFRKQASTNQGENDKSTIETLPSKPEDSPELHSVADNLVDEVISKAAGLQTETVLQEQTQKLTSVDEACTNSELTSNINIETTENAITNESTELASEVEQDTQGRTDLECDNLNKNNTNVFTEDSIAMKLANIELANEQHADLVNGDVNQNGITNGHVEVLVNGNHLMDE